MNEENQHRCRERASRSHLIIASSRMTISRAIGSPLVGATRSTCSRGVPPWCCRAAWMVGIKSRWLMPPMSLARSCAGELMATAGLAGHEHGRDGVGASEERELPGGGRPARTGGAARAKRILATRAAAWAESRVAATRATRPRAGRQRATRRRRDGQARPGVDRSWRAPR